MITQFSENSTDQSQICCLIPCPSVNPKLFLTGSPLFLGWTKNLLEVVKKTKLVVKSHFRAILKLF